MRSSLWEWLSIRIQIISKAIGFSLVTLFLFYILWFDFDTGGDPRIIILGDMIDTHLNPMGSLLVLCSCCLFPYLLLLPFYLVKETLDEWKVAEEIQERAEREAEVRRAEREAEVRRAEREADVKAMIPTVRPKLRKMANEVFKDVKNFSLDAIEESLTFTHTYDGVKLNVNYSDVFDRTYKEIKEEMIHDRDVNSGWIARRKKRSLGAGKRSRKTTCMRCGVGVSSSSSPRYYKGVKVCSNCNRGMQDEW